MSVRRTFMNKVFSGNMRPFNDIRTVTSAPLSGSTVTYTGAAKVGSFLWDATNTNGYIVTAVSGSTPTAIVKINA